MKEWILPDVDSSFVERLGDGLGHGHVLRAGHVGAEEGHLGPVELEQKSGDRL